MGDKPFFLHLKACVSRIWRPKGSLEVYSRENNFFFFRFRLKEDCDSLAKGPWHFDGRLMVLKRWTEEVGMERLLICLE